MGFGPRTELAGLTGTTCPTTSQSKSIQIAASCSLTEGAARRWLLLAGAQPQRSLRSLVPLAPHMPASKNSGRNWTVLYCPFDTLKVRLFD